MHIMHPSLGYVNSSHLTNDFSSNLCNECLAINLKHLYDCLLSIRRSGSMRHWISAGGLLEASAVIATVVVIHGGGAPTVNASGTGPTIALGAVTGTSIAVQATTEAADPYRGFNLHLHAEVPASVTLTSITAND